MATDAQAARRPLVLADSPVASAAARSAAAPNWLVWDLALMVLVSAFLLFQVQPLISKFILPWFGGSPAVWTTCMLFFQTALFFGYAYAHLTTRWLTGRQQAILHGLLLVAALIMLPIAPHATWKPMPDQEPTWRILALLAATVGLPYFVLSATGPLSQAWFSRAFAQRSPYRIYALSNVGSLAALITFPFLFEPAFAAETQAWLWSGAFVLFALLCGTVAYWIAINRGDRAASHAVDDASADSDHPAVGRKALWIALPALSTIMLLATTNHVCQNFAPVPFLWVVPLSLYLLSFIITFDHERWYRRGPYCVVLAVLVFLSAGGAHNIAWLLRQGAEKWFSGIDPDSLRLSFVQELSLYFTTLFVICMVCHGELVRLRPKPKHLTEFYLMISGGGALGGLLVSLVAPHVFHTFLEWNLGLVASYLLAMWLGLMMLGVVPRSAAAASAKADSGQPTQPGTSRRPLVAAAVGGLLATGLVLVAYWQWDNATPGPGTLLRGRNFYGIVQVKEVKDDADELHNRRRLQPGENGELTTVTDPKAAPRHFMLFRSGSIAHGRQWISDDATWRMEPTAYYSRDSGVGRALAYALRQPDAKIGVVGLGAGTLAAYPEHKSQHVRFYEINPAVVDIAQNKFTFLKDCRGTVEIVLGDARLSMEREDAQNYDVLVLDAFSGDAPPVHLLTREAFAQYKRHLKPGGIVAVNIKNQYIRLAPVVKAAADHYDFHWTRRWTDEDPERLVYPVDWMLLTNDRQFLKDNPVVLDEGEDPKIEAAEWTDHFSNLFQLLMRR